MVSYNKALNCHSFYVFHSQIFQNFDNYLCHKVFKTHRNVLRAFKPNTQLFYLHKIKTIIPSDCFNNSFNVSLRSFQAAQRFSQQKPHIILNNLSLLIHKKSQRYATII